MKRLLWLLAAVVLAVIVAVQAAPTQAATGTCSAHAVVPTFADIPNRTWVAQGQFHCEDPSRKPDLNIRLQSFKNGGWSVVCTNNCTVRAENMLFNVTLDSNGNINRSELAAFSTFGCVAGRSYRTRAEIDWNSGANTDIDFSGTFVPTAADCNG